MKDLTRGWKCWWQDGAGVWPSQGWAGSRGRLFYVVHLCSHLAEAEHRSPQGAMVECNWLYILLPGTWGYVTLHGKGPWQVWFSEGPWDGEGVLGYPDGPKVITSSFRNGKEGPRSAIQELLHWPLWVLKMTEGATSQGMLPCQHLDVTLGDPCPTPDFLKYKTIHLYCTKPTNLR